VANVVHDFQVIYALTRILLTAKTDFMKFSDSAVTPNRMVCKSAWCAIPTRQKRWLAALQHKDVALVVAANAVLVVHVRRVQPALGVEDGQQQLIVGLQADPPLSAPTVTQPLNITA